MSRYDKPSFRRSTILLRYNALTCWYCALSRRRGIPALAFTIQLYTDWASHNTDIAGDTRNVTVGPMCTPSFWKCNQLLVVHWCTCLASLESLRTVRMGSAIFIKCSARNDSTTCGEFVPRYCWLRSSPSWLSPHMYRKFYIKSANWCGSFGGARQHFYTRWSYHRCWHTARKTETRLRSVL